MNWPSPHGGFRCPSKRAILAVRRILETALSSFLFCQERFKYPNNGASLSSLQEIGFSWM